MVCGQTTFKKACNLLNTTTALAEQTFSQHLGKPLHDTTCNHVAVPDITGGGSSTFDNISEMDMLG